MYWKINFTNPYPYNIFLPRDLFLTPKLVSTENSYATSGFPCQHFSEKEKEQDRIIGKKRGEWCSNEGEVVEEISYYYSKLFTSSDSRGWEEKLNEGPPTITDVMNSSLIKHVEDNEIKVLFSM